MMTSSWPAHPYQVGGSLPLNAPSYVYRAADRDLYQALLQGEFCYVFNARQMGKSSLRVRTTHRLQAEGVQCGVVDITAIGTQQILPEQWYASIAGLLVRSFQLQVNLAQWWCDRAHLSFANRLHTFLETVLLAQVSQPIVIFIDEIDSILSLPFSVDDFFALIRSCYNQRPDQPAYRRLTFALLGVTTPSQLIADKTRTPFNIGQAIALAGFTEAEAAPMLPGLATVFSAPDLMLQEILRWTGGQPFLTQKVCQLVVQEWPQSSVPEWRFQLEQLITQRILHNWQAQDEPEHLRTIRDRLLYNKQRTGQLLGLYQQILLQSQADEGWPPAAIAAPALLVVDGDPNHTELLLSGLVEKWNGILRVKNLIYQTVFSPDWVAIQLANLRPYSQNLSAWMASGGRDQSWLLRGQALQAALDWSQDKSLSDNDYRFLAASQELQRQELQTQWEADRLQETEARLQLEQQRSLEQRRYLKQQQRLLGVMSVMMLAAIALGLFAYRQYQQTALSELQEIVLSAKALYASNKRFDALLQAIKAKQRLQQLTPVNSALKTQVEQVLEQGVAGVQEYNRLDGHTAAVMTVAFSPDGQLIASAGVDATVRLWKSDGTLLKTLTGHQPVVRSIKFSPDGTRLLSAGDDKTIRLWSRDGRLLKTITTKEHIWTVAFSPDGKTFLSGGTERRINLWDLQGRRLSSWPNQASKINAVAFSPDGQAIAVANNDNTITLLNVDGTGRKVLTGHAGPVNGIAFSPKGDQLASCSDDQTVKLWNRQGQLQKTLYGHESAILTLAFSPQGDRLVSAGTDKTVRLWGQTGLLIDTFQGHDALIWEIAFSPDGSTIATAGADNRILLWKSQNAFYTTVHGFNTVASHLTFNPSGTMIALTDANKTISLRHADGTALRTIKAHEGATLGVAFSPTGDRLLSASEDGTLKLWNLDGSLIRTLQARSTPAMTVTWNAPTHRFASANADGTIGLWQDNGTLLRTFQGHEAPIWSLVSNPAGSLLASAGNDQTIRLWNADGQAVRTLKGHTGVVWRVAFSPDGQEVISGSGDRTAKLWRTDGTLLKTLVGHTAAVWGVAFSPDGALLATGSIDETVKLWTRDGKLLKTLTGHRAGVRALAFHPQQPILASAGDDQTLILWNLTPILNLKPLIYACTWVRDYLQTNPAIAPPDRHLCDGVEPE